MKTKKEEPNNYTLRELKIFLLSLSEEQLNNHAHIAFEDETTKDLQGHCIYSVDEYVNIYDNDDYGSLEELKDIHGDEFNIEDYKILAPKGTIIFY